MVSVRAVAVLFFATAVDLEPNVLVYTSALETHNNSVAPMLEGDGGSGSGCQSGSGDFFSIDESGLALGMPNPLYAR